MYVIYANETLHTVWTQNLGQVHGRNRFKSISKHHFDILVFLHLL